MSGDTRARMIEATVEALRRRGVAGMSFTEVLRDSGAARGAIYHHFPGGKAQLVAEAAARNGQDVRDRLAGLPAGDPADVVRAFLDLVRPVMEDATQGCGCAVAAVTVDPADVGGDDAMRRLAATAFGAWADQIAERLTASGLPPQEAAGLATTLVTLLEGAQVLCRAAGTLEPFEEVAGTVTALVAARG